MSGWVISIDTSSKYSEQHKWAANWSKCACLKLKCFIMMKYFVRFQIWDTIQVIVKYIIVIKAALKRNCNLKHSCLLFWHTIRLKWEQTRTEIHRWPCSLISLSVLLDPGASKRPLRLQQKRLLTVMISKIGQTSFLSDALWQKVRNQTEQELYPLR